MRLRVNANEPPVAHIAIKGDADPADLMAWVVSLDGYRAAGLDPRLAPSHVRLVPSRTADGATVLKVEGLAAATGPVELLVIAAGDKGSRVGRYRLDLSPGAREIAMTSVGRDKLGAKANSAPAAPLGAPRAEQGGTVQAGAPTAPAIGSEADTAGAQSAVEAWRDAWSRRDMTAYLAAYAPDYQGREAGQTREQWVRERTSRIRDRAHIEVQISDLHLSRRADTVLASFRQTYRADSVVSRSRKQLVLREFGGRWLIVQESELR
jgi:ketosteroid isomerase-like protein